MHALDRQTDRQTYSFLIAGPRLHSMQRCKNELKLTLKLAAAATKIIAHASFKDDHVSLISISHRDHLHVGANFADVSPFNVWRQKWAVCDKLHP